MIYYVSSGWGLLYIFRLRGSVLPKALCWAIPSAVATVLFKKYEQVLFDLDMTGVQEMWGGFTFVLGFMIVFRNNQAYMRFWEGATLIQQVRGEWFNAVSSLIAFCRHTRDKAEKAEVEEFQHLLVRLMSMLYCCALQQVAVVDDNNFEIIDNTGLDQESLIHLANSVDRCEIILQWVQRLIVEGHNSGILQISAPILSRSFQELSRGIVNLNNVRKIKEIPLPFPYSQACMVMLLLHWLFTPLFASQSIETTWCAAVTSFLTAASFWALNYIAQEIEQPFGEDANDLPIAEMQMDMNRSLCVLLHPKTQVPPSFSYVRNRDTTMLTRPSDLDLMMSPDDESPPPGEELDPIFESEDVDADAASVASSEMYLPSRPPSGGALAERQPSNERERTSRKASFVSHMMSNVPSMQSFATSRRTSTNSQHTTITTISAKRGRGERNSVTSNQTMVSKFSMRSVRSNRSIKTTSSIKSVATWRAGAKNDSAYKKMVAKERAKAQARAVAQRTEPAEPLRISEGIIGEKKRPAYVRVRSFQESNVSPSEDIHRDDSQEVADESDGPIGPATHTHGISRGGIGGKRASFRSEADSVTRSADVLLTTPSSASPGSAHTAPLVEPSALRAAPPAVLNGPTSMLRPSGGDARGSKSSAISSDTEEGTKVVARGSVVEGFE